MDQDGEKLEGWKHVKVVTLSMKSLDPKAPRQVTSPMLPGSRSCQEEGLKTSACTTPHHEIWKDFQGATAYDSQT